MGKGDVVYFAAGDTAVWTVESHVQKIAVFRRPMPKTFGQLLAVYHKAMARFTPASQPARGSNDMRRSRLSCRILAGHADYSIAY